MWLEFNGIPLKWHYPIGVLLDIYFNDIQLPWNIVVHFDKFPENVLMHCQNKYVIQIAKPAEIDFEQSLLCFMIDRQFHKIFHKICNI